MDSVYPTGWFHPQADSGGWEGGGSFIWKEMLGTTNEFGKWPRKEKKKKNITGVLRKQISPCKPHPLPPGKPWKMTQSAPYLACLVMSSANKEHLC